jgi:hypothetical protein
VTAYPVFRALAGRVSGSIPSRQKKHVTPTYLFGFQETGHL